MSTVIEEVKGAITDLENALHKNSSRAEAGSLKRIGLRILVSADRINSSLQQAMPNGDEMTGILLDGRALPRWHFGRRGSAEMAEYVIKIQLVSEDIAAGCSVGCGAFRHVRFWLSIQPVCWTRARQGALYVSDVVKSSAAARDKPGRSGLQTQRCSFTVPSHVKIDCGCDDEG